jgi:hypothetical protein
VGEAEKGVEEMIDKPITTYSDENRPVRMHTSVTQGRVQHYSDVVEYMAAAAIDRFRAKYKREPHPSQVEFLKKELVRYTVIRRDLDTANKIDINPTNILNEAHCLSSRSELLG